MLEEREIHRVNGRQSENSHSENKMLCNYSVSHESFFII